MATEINAGRVAMVPKGEWASATAYTRLDVVLYNGSSWVAIADSTGQVPSEDSTYWQLLASGVDPSNYYTKNETNTKLGSKQDTLVTGQNIKSINGQSVLGGGNMTIHEEQLIDKSYAPAEFSGLGRKYLQKNIVSDKNVLTQAMISEANTEFVVQYDYDLNDPNGENPITIPANSVLNFAGGTIKNGVIDLNGCTINADTKIFEDVVPAENSILVQDINPMWFGAKGDGVTDDTDAWEACIAFTKQIKPANLNTFRQYNRPQARISAPKHAHFKITRPLTITFQCDIVGGFRFDYYGAYPAENTGIINFYGTFSQCTYQFDVRHAHTSTTSTSAFYPNWSNVPQFAGVCIGSADHPTIMEECQVTIGAFKCQVGIRLHGCGGSAYISSNTFRQCRFSVCIIGILNHIDNATGTSAWNNDMKFLNCEFRPQDSGYTIPTGTERYAFVKVDGAGNLQMNSTRIDGLSLESKPFNLPVSILWVDKDLSVEQRATSGLRISNVRIEAIGTDYIKSNCNFDNCLIDNPQLQDNHFYATIGGVTFDAYYTEIPGFEVVMRDYARPIYTFDQKDLWDEARPAKFVTAKRLYRIKNTLLTYTTSVADVPKVGTAGYLTVGVPFTLKNGGTMQIKAATDRTEVNFIAMIKETNYDLVHVSSNEFYVKGCYYYKALQEDEFYYAFKHTTLTNEPDLFIGNKSGRDVIVVIVPSSFAFHATLEVYGDGNKVILYDSGDNYAIEGTLANRPNLLSADDGYEYFCTDNGIKYTFDKVKGWLTESGYTSNVNSGATADRPLLGFGEDGYKFHDTILNKDIYSKVIQEPVFGGYIAARIADGQPSTSVISNTLTERQVYLVGYSAKQAFGGSLAFRKTADSSDGQIIILSNFNSNDKGAYFVAPSPTEYPYIYIYNYYTGPEIITFYKPFTTWLNEDGFAVGARQGDTASRPQLNFGDDGCRYYDTTINRSIYSKVGKGAPVISEAVTGPTPSVVANTLSEGKTYWIGINNWSTYGGSLRFRKTAESSDGEIWALTTLNNRDYGLYFVAPSPTDYPYIYIEVARSGLQRTFTFQEAATSWVEEDGATAGVARSGDTASRPASTDIYTGFQYFDTDLGKYICWNGSAWVNLDGTALA